MSAKILLSIVALGGVGLAALPADVLHKPNQEPVALRMDQTPVTQQVASLVPVAPPMPATPGAEAAPVAATPGADAAPVAATPAVPAGQPEGAFPPPNAEVATVGDSNLNARQGPATSYDKVFVVPAGEQLAVLDKQGTWVQVKRSSGETGWVHSSYLVGGQKADRQERRVASTDTPRKVPVDNAAPPTKRAMLGAGSVLFASPSRSSQPISRVEAGERLRVGERRGDWVRVVTSQGFSGWLLVR